MRLTLRTLLAYLDDTLEPHEIKEIGQKVAESDAAQELVARIKQITRRRRLTTPPANGPGARFDANTVAEYLDNELSTDLVAELEKTCLESDVHLAEVASCHQILTLVLGEPALVPPTARERMYGLVKGREAIPFRKARTDRRRRRRRRPRRRRPAAARHAVVARLADLGAAARRRRSSSPSSPSPSGRGCPSRARPSTSPSTPTNPLRRRTRPPTLPGPLPSRPHCPSRPWRPRRRTRTLRRRSMTPKDKDAPPPPKDKGPDKPVEPPPPPPPPPGNGRPNPPSKDRVAIGRYVAARASILVQRQADQPAWKRVVPGAVVATADDLVSLPGYSSELDLGRRRRPRAAARQRPRVLLRLPRHGIPDGERGTTAQAGGRLRRRPDAGPRPHLPVHSPTGRPRQGPPPLRRRGLGLDAAGAGHGGRRRSAQRLHGRISTTATARSRWRCCT